ncbi:MAG TPA: hypothetical protein DCG58_16045 [Hyphomonas adhaerens]|uniref:Uncharacterized protein n=2 Tax=Hyphomonadaceae TaxID=69657 RepID=A0A3B9H2I8_9PROT|nr:hypothetical protein [Hyphomonas sp.]HAE28676.1 hypothetical protein [Hyphomonas adhaerens]
MRIPRLLACVFTFSVLSSGSHAQGNSHDIGADMIGQTPPGLTPELFAPGLVSTDNLEIEGVFAPGMTEFYFVRQVSGDVPKTHSFQYKDGDWQESIVGPRTGEVFISVDGKTMYLGNEYRERKDSGWSEQKSLGSPFEDIPVMRLTASADGTYVFDERHEVGTIRYSRLVDGERQAPQAFSEEVNSGTFTAHPFIAPDESYLIWDSEREDGYGDSDLYISFRQDDGSWGPAINMGDEINTEFEDAYGSVTPDGKYFFFHTINLSEPKANIFWVDALIIESLRQAQ